MTIKNKKLIGALGDSITAGCNTQNWGDNSHHSWSTGSDPNVGSHANNLKLLYPDQEIVTHNFAVSGATSHDLNRQTKQLVNKGKIDYTTILIGTNDVLNFDENFKPVLENIFSNVYNSVEELVKNNTLTKILIVGLPDLLRLPTVLLNSGLGALVRQFMQNHPFFRNKDIARLQAYFQPRLQDVNAALASLEKMFPTQVRFCREVSEAAFDKQHLSPIDFFHPSVLGQKRIAEVSWNKDWLLS